MIVCKGIWREIEAWVCLLTVAAQSGARPAAPESPEGTIPACISRLSSLLG